MTANLIPENPLLFSPSLASTIGLEEAILIQHIDSLISAIKTGSNKNCHHLKVSLNDLSFKLPFWKPSVIHRILQNLIELGIISLEPLPTDETQQIEIKINYSQKSKKFDEKNKEIASNHILGVQKIPENWRPDENIVQKLKLQRIEEKFILENVDEFVLYWRERNQASHSWGSKFMQHITRRWQKNQIYNNPTSHESTNNIKIEKEWQPNSDALEILERMGINRNFIDDAIPEFILYWRERNEAKNTWNSKFVNHVKRQWAKFTHTLKHDTDPKPMTEYWKPDVEVFDILEIANIDLQFAREIIPEFILFWRDKNELHHSWNTKYLQHVKYRWSRRNTEKIDSKGDAFERLSDRSWASDLI